MQGESRAITKCHIAALLAVAGITAGIGCGGGETAVIGVGNSGNRFVMDELAEDVAEALAKEDATPRVTDEMITEVFQAILDGARRGDAQAALIVLRTASAQRRPPE